MTGAEHRQLQLALRSATLRDLIRLWPLFNPKDIAGSWPGLEVALVALIEARSHLSSALAATYVESLGTTAVLAEVPGTEEIAQSLRFVGARWAGRQVAQNTDPAKIAETALVNVSGDVTRQVLNAGRATVAASAMRDRRVTGIQRVTDGRPCAWCASQADGIHPPHSHFGAHLHCGCFPELVYG